MSGIFQCGDSGTLVGYLYDECEAAERDAVSAHVAVCAACAAELAALGSAREQLRAWTPPDAKLGFIITERQPAEPAPRAAGIAPRRTSWLARPLPVWAQAAAAALVFGVGLSLGIARGTFQPAPAVGTEVTATRTSSAVVPAAELSALERRLRDEIAAIRNARDTSPPPQASRSEAQLLARVRAMIDESERRQQRELAIRTTQIVRDFESQRRTDLAQIQRSFGQIEGLTNAEVREQREMLNYLMRVSQQR